MKSMPDVINERFTLYRDPSPARVATFGEDVRAGLGATPKTLPPKYFYDDLGSSLFEAITRLPEYYLTRIERDLLYGCSREIVGALDGPLELLELGSGSALKTRFVIEAILERQKRLVFCPVDISADALIDSSHALVAANEQLDVRAYASDYFALLERVDFRSSERTLTLFLGSNIGNFEPGEASRLLALLANALASGDALLIGFDLKKDVAILEAAYDDPTGVTAAFDKNLLARVNRELGGEFDVRTFRHVVRYDETRGAVDSFLECAHDCRVHIRSLDLAVDFQAGERIHTESSYKFTPDEIAVLAERSGFAPLRTWTDAAQRYALSLFTVR